MRKPISEATRTAVLETAWDLMATQGRLDVTLAEIAAAAGVSRQTVFYAVGNRAGLLVEMARHKDTLGDQTARLSALARGPGADEKTLHEFLDVWLEYLPQVYPVAIQLEVASLTDADAAIAWNDRFVVKGLRRGFELILGRMAAAGRMAKGLNPSRIADLCVALVAPSAWRLLVVECGWTPEAFAQSRHALLAAALRPPAKA